MSSFRAPSQWIAIAFLAIPSFAASQSLKPGTWTGTVNPPGEAAVDANFEVRVAGDTIGITLKGEFGEFPLSDVKLSADRLMFTFSPGTTVRCTLQLGENGGYSGDCTDSDGGTGVIVMNPPGTSPGAAGRGRS
jgi:hypothetical protein